MFKEINYTLITQVVIEQSLITDERIMTSPRKHNFVIQINLINDYRGRERFQKCTEKFGIMCYYRKGNN